MCFKNNVIMFKEAFKYYKRKCPPPDLKDVITLSNQQDKLLQKEPWLCDEDINLNELGLVPFQQWNIFELKNHPGLLLIENPFTKEGMWGWVERCLAEYPAPPNKSNLHIHGLLDPEENWWKVCNTDLDRKEKLEKQMRWVTLGYHHNWDTKVYSEENKSKMPDDLVKLTRCIGRILGGWDLQAEAAILNFYRLDSTLSGHTDHSEPNLTSPLVSISFGQSAIFLIGGKSIEEPVSALLINNGDIVIMAGESRLCYHGVPKVLKSRTFEGRDKLSDYLNDARINLNIRQVLKPGQSSLP